MGEGKSEKNLYKADGLVMDVAQVVDCFLSIAGVFPGSILSTI